MNEQVIVQRDPHEPLKTDKREKLGTARGALLLHLYQEPLILAGWLLSGYQVLSIILFLLAFVIGGFAKAKEGIEETLESKTLNVELLMIFAAVGSALIGYWAEGAILIFIFSLSGAFRNIHDE